MNDRQYKKMMRKFTFMWFLALAVLLFLWWTQRSTDTTNLHKYVDDQIEQSSLKDMSNVQLPAPKDGKDGADGQDGKDGRDGKDGSTTVIQNKTTEIIQQPVQGQKGDQGEKGEQGEQGEPGRPVLLQVDPETKDLQYKYEGDTFWNTLLPCKDLVVGCVQ